MDLRLLLWFLFSAGGFCLSCCCVVVVVCLACLFCGFSVVFLWFFLSCAVVLLVFLLASCWLLLVVWGLFVCGLLLVFWLVWLFLCSSSGVLIVGASVFSVVCFPVFCGCLPVLVFVVCWFLLWRLLAGDVGSVCLLLWFLSWLFLLACLGVAYGSSAIFLACLCGRFC